MSHLGTITSDTTDWTISDSLQFSRKLAETCYDFIQITIYPGERYSASHISLNINNYSKEELDKYSLTLGYKDYADLKESLTSDCGIDFLEHILSGIAMLSADKHPKEKFNDIEALNNWLSYIDYKLKFDGFYVSIIS